MELFLLFWDCFISGVALRIMEPQKGFEGMLECSALGCGSPFVEIYR